MIDHEKHALAQATVNMGFSSAFLDMLGGLREDTEKLEFSVLASTSVDEDRVTRAKFLEWQAHRRVVSAIEATIKNAEKYLKEVQEEIDIERANERDRGTRGNW